MDTNQSCCRQDSNAKCDDNNGNVSTLENALYENSVFSHEKKMAPDTPTKAMDTSDNSGTIEHQP